MIKYWNDEDKKYWSDNIKQYREWDYDFKDYFFDLESISLEFNFIISED